MGDLGDGKHDGGPKDPRIGVIKVEAKTATYAIAEGTILGRGGEIAKGVITGSPPKVNQLREISEQELEQCKWPPSIPTFLLQWTSNTTTCLEKSSKSLYICYVTPSASRLRYENVVC